MMVISKLRINWFVKIIGYGVEKCIYLIDRSSLSMDVSMYCREKEKYEDGAKDREKSKWRGRWNERNDFIEFVRS